jgi:hypothetical protein
MPFVPPFALRFLRRAYSFPEITVQLCVNLVTRPQPGLRTRVVVLVIILLTVIVIRVTGSGLPDALTLILGAGLAGAKVARSLVPGTAAAEIRP